MDGIQWEVAENIPDLPGLNIVLYDLRKRLTDVSSAVGSLEVSILDDGHRCIG
jgi:hypothetical protein